MLARSSSARSVISTRYAMLAPERSQRFPRGRHAAFGHIFATLPDALFGVCLGCKVEQALVGRGVLHHRGCLAVDRQNQRAFGFLELLKNRRGMVSKSGQGLNILSD